MIKFVIMKTEPDKLEPTIVENIRIILKHRGLNQAKLATVCDMTEQTVSKIMRGDQNLSLYYLAKIARGLNLREIDLITWPAFYQAPSEQKEEPSEVFLQLKLKKEKKDQVLKLVFGENNIEIFNK